MSRNNREKLLDELDAVTSVEQTTRQTTTDDNTEIMENLQVITKAMERLVKDVQQLKQDNVAIWREIMELKQSQNAMGNQLGDMEFGTGADQDLRDWMRDEANEDAFDTAMTRSEMARGINEMAERRARFGMH